MGPIYSSLQKAWGWVDLVRIQRKLSAGFSTPPPPNSPGSWMHFSGRSFPPLWVSLCLDWIPAAERQEQPKGLMEGSALNYPNFPCTLMDPSLSG